MGIEKINIFIGYDELEQSAYHVLCQSIFETCSLPVSITPVKKNLIPEYDRSRSEVESTDFSLTRFLVPYLSNYEGWSLFLDCDFIIKSDLKEIWDLRDKKYSVMVCKHDYEPKLEKKFKDLIQTSYEMKNWSSFILFNNKKCKKLSLKYVNEATGLELHQFKWLKNEKHIGSLPLEWNYLVGEENQVEKPKGIHFTNGGPWFPEFRKQEYGDEWASRLSSILNASRKANISGSIFLDNKEYEIIKSPFTKSDKKTDYKQLRNINSGTLYLLKEENLIHRGFKQKIPFIYTQYVGSEIAKYFNFRTQNQELIHYQGKNVLLTKDIRSSRQVEGMEPLSLMSGKIINESRNMDRIYEEISQFTTKEVVCFLTHVFLFDTLIGNNQRDARSFRIFKLKKDFIPIDAFDCLKNNYDFLIENNFGCGYLSEGDNRPLYTSKELIDFIERNKTKVIARDFFEMASPQNIIKIINNIELITDDMKKEFISIFKRQFEILLEVEDYFFDDLSD